MFDLLRPTKLCLRRPTKTNTAGLAVFRMNQLVFLRMIGFTRAFVMPGDGFDITGYFGVLSEALG
ncbi:hypothetical protein TIFTF001_017468 [Ficus carica]|uniref:Uncharacterized protein n=1 Tax=Ficus carica TaxID=3494 RepID=A0AA88AUE4_FICCA|nr:hypothetical protein TIFTF001_017468 [Ficus carica]